MGWYHSHPGYGCWLSGIDVGTQMTNQKYQASKRVGGRGLHSQRLLWVHPVPRQRAHSWPLRACRDAMPTHLCLLPPSHHTVP